MHLSSPAVFSIVACAITALLLSEGASAQMYRPESFERPDAAPALNLSLSGALVQSLNVERDLDFRSFEAFGGGKRGVDRFGAERAPERPEGWKFYGRVYILNFQNIIGETPLKDTQIGFRRTGPGIAGKVYFGVTKRW